MCHSVLDTESSKFKMLWIPAFAGMTEYRDYSKVSKHEFIPLLLHEL